MHFFAVFLNFLLQRPSLFLLLTLIKVKNKISPNTNIKGSPFTTSENASLLNVFTSVKGSAFFFASVLSFKLHNMRSVRIESRKRVFYHSLANLLSFIIEHNTVNIEGDKSKHKW